jgi:hypothetical protein
MLLALPAVVITQEALFEVYPNLDYTPYLIHKHLGDVTASGKAYV